MAGYRDMRVFSLENGGIYAEKVQTELAVRYQGEWALRFPFSIKEHPAFVVLNKELHTLISVINQQNIKLTMLCSQLPASAMRQFATSAMVEEIQQSNEFENVNSTRREIKEAVDGLSDASSQKRFTGMVRKYDMLISHKDIPLNTSGDVRKLYDEFILDEVLRENPDHAPDGIVFRKDPNYVNRGDRIIHEGLFPERKIIDTMDGALSMLSDESIDPLIRVAAFHYAFGYIHPFYDGNGRMTRFISSYMLSRYGYCESACLRISYVIKDHRQLYQRIFKNANDDRSMGDITCFVIEFLRLVRQAVEDTHEALYEKLQAYRHYQALLDRYIEANQKALGKYDTLLSFLLQADLFGDGYFDVQELACIAFLSTNTVRKILLLCSGLIAQEKDGVKFIYHIDRGYLDRLPQNIPNQ